MTLLAATLWTVTDPGAVSRPKRQAWNKSPITERPCDECGAPIRRADRPKSFHRARFCSIACSTSHALNPDGNRSKNKRGYVIVTLPGRVRIYEHRLVMERVLGRKLQPAEVVHHKNGIRDDNRPENLEVITNSAHVSMHHAEYTAHGLPHPINRPESIRKRVNTRWGRGGDDAR